ncbi:MAG: hypothetical protein IJO64_05020 [Clostridia bacterium]|nr:hypothetical protein [Clostridia bacterium]
MGNYVSDSLKADMNDGKKKITPQLIYDSLELGYKSNIVLYVILFILVLFLCGLFFLVFRFDSPFNEKGKIIADAVLIALPILTAVFCAYFYFRGIKKHQEREYTVIVDTIERVVVDDRYVHQRRHSHMEHAMYLWHCGRVVISYAETSLHSEGDKAFVVVDKKHPNVPLMIFNDKYYELVDIEPEEL